MSLRYEFAWDFARALDGVGASVKVTDAGGTVEITPFTTGQYAHTDLQSVMGSGDYDDFATALQTALNAASSSGNYTVSYSSTTGYTIAYDGGNYSLTFSTTANTTQGVNMRDILGMSGDRSGAATYSSQVRPYFLIWPVTQGRSEVSDDYEPEGLAQEATADDGSTYSIAVENAVTWADWIQVGDQDQPTTLYTISSGTHVHTRFGASTKAPWTYAHAFAHHRTAFDPILVVDGSDSIVCQMRADKCSFKPKRMGSADFDLWSVAFGVEVIGRL